ncbi:MAG TPA: hypothetical protein VGR98_00730 [Streptosporangiaceae bacterium]|nr:hypothetical protein [Streptosporangiaceae bacterium]
MPSYPWSASRDGSGFEDTALAALLAGSELPPGAAARLQPVADVLAALNASPASEEMAGLAAAQAEFRRTVARPARAHRPRRARRAVLGSLLGAKLAAAAAIAVVGLGGVATASYAGALPGSWQQFAHRMIGAPAPHRADSGAPADPHAAYRLCTAYLHATAGSAAQRAAAFRSLVRAAGGAGHVTAFCAAAPRPGSSPPLPYRSPQPQGRRTGRPSPHPTGPPAGRPSPHPTGPPAGRPSPHPTGRPSPHPTRRPSPHPTGRPSPHSAV